MYLCGVCCVCVCVVCVCVCVCVCVLLLDMHVCVPVRVCTSHDTFSSLHFFLFTFTSMFNQMQEVQRHASSQSLVVKTQLTDRQWETVSDLTRVVTRGWAASTVQRWIQQSQRRRLPVSNNCLSESKTKGFCELRFSSVLICLVS